MRLRKGHVLTKFCRGEHCPSADEPSSLRAVSRRRFGPGPSPTGPPTALQPALPSTGQDRRARGHVLGPVGGWVAGRSENGPVTAAENVTGAGPRDWSQRSESEPLPSAALRERALQAERRRRPRCAPPRQLALPHPPFFWALGRAPEPRTRLSVHSGWVPSCVADAATAGPRLWVWSAPSCRRRRGWPSLCRCAVKTCAPSGWHSGCCLPPPPLPAPPPPPPDRRRGSTRELVSGLSPRTCHPSTATDQTAGCTTTRQLHLTTHAAGALTPLPFPLSSPSSFLLNWCSSM